MRQPLIVGLGRSGAGLHLRALRTALGRSPGLWQGPVIAVDPRPGLRAPVPDHVTVTPSLERARALLPPDRAVVHVCTPPVTRPAVLAALCDAGYRDLIVEKPLAADAGELAAVERLCARHGLRLAVVAHWPASALAHRLRELARGAGPGRLLRIDVAQHKPRFTRGLRPDDGHPTAFDVEMPHSLGLVLTLVGPAEVTAAALTDLRVGEAVRPGLGSARLDLRHTGGVRTRIVSDLTAPVRQRTVTLTFEHGTAVGHFAPSDADDHVQLVADGRREVFRDDALAAFLHGTYTRFATVPVTDPSWAADLALHADVVRLLGEAKRLCAGDAGGAGDGAARSAGAGRGGPAGAAGASEGGLAGAAGAAERCLAGAAGGALADASGTGTVRGAGPEPGEVVRAAGPVPGEVVRGAGPESGEAVRGSGPASGEAVRGSGERRVDAAGSGAPAGHRGRGERVDGHGVPQDPGRDDGAPPAVRPAAGIAGTEYGGAVRAAGQEPGGDVRAVEPGDAVRSARPGRGDAVGTGSGRGAQGGGRDAGTR